jgi:Flp pilus assembly protein TadG
MISKLGGALARRRDGAVGILGALVLPALLVTLGLAVEYGNGLLNNVRDQRVADNAAFAAATVYQQNSNASLASVVDGIAALDGLSASNISANLVASPSGNGLQSVKVTVTTQSPLLLSQALGSSLNALTTSATAYAELGPGDDCVLALDPGSTGKPAQITGGTVNLNCGLQANSSSSQAFNSTGGTFTADTIDVVGQTSIGGTVHATITQGAPSIADPFSGLFAANSVGSLTNQSCPSVNKGVHFNSDATVTPPTTGQVYCNGLTISGGTVTFQPGVYIIQGGTLSVSNGTLQGTGVTIILTCGTPPCTSSSSSWAQLSLTGGTTNLAAPTSGAWSGMLFYQDPTNSTDAGKDKNSITGGGNSLEGVLYFPNETTDFTGGSSAASCTEIITYDIDFTGGGTVNHNNCVSAGIKGFGAGGSVRLIQ